MLSNAFYIDVFKAQEHSLGIDMDKQRIPEI